jgi:hypothetical protein
MSVRALFILFLITMPSIAMACSCLEPNDKTASESYKKSDVIVKGRIQSASSGWSEMGPMVKIEVIDVIKGNEVPDIITSNYNNFPAACGHDLKAGEEAIFALYDTRSLTVTNNNLRGYGFRMMVSCHQNQVRHYIENLPEKMDIAP